MLNICQKNLLIVDSIRKKFKILTFLFVEPQDQFFDIF